MKREIEQHLEQNYESFGLSLDLDEEMGTGYLCITFEEPEYPSISEYAEKITRALEITDSEIRADYQPREHKYELEISEVSDRLVSK